MMRHVAPGSPRAIGLGHRAQQAAQPGVELKDRHAAETGIFHQHGQNFVDRAVQRHQAAGHVGLADGKAGVAHQPPQRLGVADFQPGFRRQSVAVKRFAAVRPDNPQIPLGQCALQNAMHHCLECPDHQLLRLHTATLKCLQIRKKDAAALTCTCSVCRRTKFSPPSRILPSGQRQGTIS